jgi:sirohydrochlorin ferrochelatase
LLIAHGSARYPDAGRTVQAHAATLRHQGHFAEVAVGFLNGTPTVAEAMATLGSRPVQVVPFFMEDGYFARVAVPQALAGVGRPIVLPPIGTHPGLAEVISDRVERTLADKIPDEIVLIGHGSSRAPGRRMALHGHAERLRRRFPTVRIAFLEEAPFVAEVLAALPTGRPVAIVGVFAGEGGHVRDDLPALIAAGRTRLGEDLIELGSVGDDEGMAALILDHVVLTRRHG